MEQWEGEVEILEEEFRHLVRGCEKMRVVWSELAAKAGKPGYAIYAREKASMYHRMGREAREKFANADGTWPAAGVTAAQHAHSLRPNLIII